MLPQDPSHGLQYRELPPGPRLQPHVACYWALRAPAPLSLRDRTFPDGCQELIFNIGTRVLRSDDGRAYARNPDAELVGQMTRPYDVLAEGEQLYFGVKFLPHGFAVFCREPVDSLRDQSIDLRLLFGPAFGAVHERIATARRLSVFVDEMEAWLDSRLCERRAASAAYRAVDRVVAALLARPDGSGLHAACADPGIGPRRLQGAFRELVGLSPRQLRGMLRFQSCFRGLQAGMPPAQLALACGYYDQAHFNREFRHYAGMSPGAWKRAGAPLNRFFLDADSRAWLCNGARVGR
ncbi:helix-turn-helix domain-containing protein [Luteimonas composti]|uniref:Helix-turn-helix domain-containing protein n=1 Tax=Luteimonas composti TaxID=398257 RepID=A0ABT6MNM3_9GAMM|nr:helix-turn-helix domain-containing protein [Luteimonas composti]MDH7452192.1 helix-turn-helix domain-containing protein [Luteimonas composti]